MFLVKSRGFTKVTLLHRKVIDWKGNFMNQKHRFLAVMLCPIGVRNAAVMSWPHRRGHDAMAMMSRATIIENQHSWELPPWIRATPRYQRRCWLDRRLPPPRTTRRAVAYRPCLTAPKTSSVCQTSSLWVAITAASHQPTESRCHVALLFPLKLVIPSL